FAKGHLLYKKSEKHAYVYDMIKQQRFSSFLVWIKALNGKHFFKDKKSALATIFLKPNCNETSVGQIIKRENHESYFKNNEIVTLPSIKNIIMTMIYDDIELAGTNLMEGKGFLCLVSFDVNMKKELYVKEAFHECRELIRCSIFVNSLKIKDNTLETNSINHKISTIYEIYSVV
ncbi:35431_t:CDS:1, partial [Gigaspora margarita]